ncbi:MAG: sulfotransferase domain-containing protein [Symploca sp. SIO2E9]|nr:sulfotransferase domain-containing protein [Symploca sp. SIO2E9]
MLLEQRIKSLVESEFGEILKRVSTVPMPNNQQEAYRLVRYLDLPIPQVARIRGKDITDAGIKLGRGFVSWPSGTVETDNLRFRLLALAKKIEPEERLFQSQKPVFEVIWELNKQFDVGIKRWQEYQDLAAKDIEARLPNFLVLGAPKSATTWLYACLAAHPDVFVPVDKELEFFGTHRYYLGLNWYKPKFANWNSQQAVGEVSVGYFSYEQAAEQIYKTLDSSSLKLIVLLREPLDCALSFYFHWLLRGEAPRTFEESFKFRRFRRFYHRTVNYYQHYQKYLQYFEKDQILIILFEEIKQQPLAVLKRVFEFLNVDVDYYNQVFERKKNIGYSIKNLNLHYLLHHTEIVCRELLPSRISEKISYRLREHNNKVNIINQRPTQQIEQRIYRQLQQEYHLNNQKLAELAGIDLSRWDCL